MKVSVYPNLIISPEQHANPYIKDFINALNALPDVCVVNPPHKNPLLSLFPPRNWGDVFIFNWFENLPEVKHGWLQSLAGICFLPILRLTGRKIVWVLHNKGNHTGRHAKMSRFLRRHIARQASLIITHATEGIKVAEKELPFAVHKTHFLHHPTKDRISGMPDRQKEKVYDLLIWGHISKYKGVIDFVRYLVENNIHDIRVCIAGKCASTPLREELEGLLPANVTYVGRSLPFGELGEYIAKSHFVLTPYSPESILSSGALMDSLSFGAKVIGPNVGSFRDYSEEPSLEVYTFNSFEDIPSIIKGHKDKAADKGKYTRFLQTNDWNNFAKTLMELIKK